MRLSSAAAAAALAGALVLSPLAALAAPVDDVPVVQEKELSDARSVLALINPTIQLDPVDYTPKDLVNVDGTSYKLRPEAAKAVENLVADARAAGHSIKVLSAFRSYQRQAALFNQYQAKYGTAYAERISARPGTSEHQLGLAADVGYISGQAELKESFGQTPAGRWIAEHAVDYGLIIRYPQGMEKTTGYKYEPWHVRYIGKKQAKAMAESGAATYEEYYELLQQAASTEPVEQKAPKKETKPSAEPSEDSAASSKPEQVSEDDLWVLRFLPPYRDWSFGFTH